jgi:hypothetical protein
MQHLTIINDFTTLLHRHGPDSDEVESFILQYDHLEGFVSKAKTLQSVFREKDRVTQAHA